MLVFDHGADVGKKAQGELIDRLREMGLWPHMTGHASGMIVAAYDYADEEGNLLYQAVRKHPKAFFQRQPDGGGGWVNRLGPDVRRVPYRLPQLIAAARGGQTVWIVEGEKDAEALARHGMVATTNSGGAGKWRSEFSTYFEGATVVIVPDNDEPGKKHALDIAMKLHGHAEVKMIEWPEGFVEKGDVSDFLADHGIDDLLALADAAPVFMPGVEPVIGAKSSTKKYVGNLSDLLDRVVAAHRRYVIVPLAEYVALALWTAHTHAIDASDATGYPWCTSPEPESGKTRLLEVAHLLVRDGVLVTDLTGSTLFRLMDAHPHTTLLIDEVDHYWKEGEEREDVRALLNAGYRRGNVALRNEKVDGVWVPVRYDPFGCKALAGIGTGLPRSLTTRTIPIPMKPKTADDRVAKFRIRSAKNYLKPIHDDLAAWAADASVIQALRDARPEMPAGVRDRVEDMWEPLLAIADLAGGAWPRRARRAMVAIHGGREAIAASNGVLLLQHVRDAFNAAARHSMTTVDLLKVLVERDDGPWAVWWEKDVEALRFKSPARKMAGLLRRYGVTSRKIRVGEKTFNGYDRDDLADAWKTYLDRDSAPPLPSGGSSDGTTEQSAPDAGFMPFSQMEHDPDVPLSKIAESPTGMPNVPLFHHQNGNLEGQDDLGHSNDAVRDTPTAEEVEEVSNALVDGVTIGGWDLVGGWRPAYEIFDSTTADQVLDRARRLGWPAVIRGPYGGVAGSEDAWRDFMNALTPDRLRWAAGVVDDLARRREWERRVDRLEQEIIEGVDRMLHAADLSTRGANDPAH